MDLHAFSRSSGACLTCRIQRLRQRDVLRPDAGLAFSGPRPAAMADDLILNQKDIVELQRQKTALEGAVCSRPFFESEH